MQPSAELMRQLDAFNRNEFADYADKSNSFYAGSEPLVRPAGHFDLSTCSCISERSNILLGWTCCIFKVNMPLLAIQLSRMLD